MFSKIGNPKNRMYGHHKCFFSTYSCGFNPIQSTTRPQSCAQCSQNIFWIFLLGQKAGQFDTIWVKWTRFGANRWFWCPKSSKNHEMSDVRASPAPPQPKSMRETKYLDPKAWHEKRFFKKRFFAIFSTFFDTSTSQFSRFSRFGDVSVPTNVLPVRKMCTKTSKSHSISRKITDNIPWS